jgi:DNA repair ATPase RecN
MSPLGQVVTVPLEKTPRGAAFVRADLHIHSYRGSYDVDDVTMTPPAIIDTAIAKGLSVISITDHNSTASVPAGLAAAESKPILVVPGVELSTPGGHLLVYMETVEGLDELMAKLTFSGDRKACRTSAADVLQLVESLGGLAIAAHIDLDSGLEKAISGYGDPKSSVICSKALAALEISSASALHWYSDIDPDTSRKAIFRKRIEALADPFVGVIPRIQSSDAHTLKALGRNYAQTEKLTRLKMATLNWRSFRAAFVDPEARVRTEEGIPNATAGFVAMRLSGGFLDGQTLGFSPNLTCIIGGRGSGKSTAFASLRAVAGTYPPEDLLASDAWPDEIDVVYRDEFGAETHVRLTRDGLMNISNPAETVPHIAIESLAQGEMARTIEKCGEDPTALLTFLDDLVDLREHRELAELVRKQLAENGAVQKQLRRDLGHLAPTETLLKQKQALQETARREKGTELIDLQNQLAAAALLRKQLLPNFKQVIADLKATLSPHLLHEVHQLADESRALEKPEKPSPIPGLVSRLEVVIREAAAALDAELKTGTAEINAFVAEVQAAQQKLSDDVKARVEALAARGIPLDIRALGILAETIRTLTTKVSTLRKQQTSYQEAATARTKLVEAYLDAQATVSRERVRLATRLNSQLSQTLHDLTVELTFGEGRLSAEAEEVLKYNMDWRTSAVPKAQALVRAIGVPALLKAIQAGNAGAIAAARTPDNHQIVTSMEASNLVMRFRNTDEGAQLEQCRYADMPSLIVRRPLRDTSGNQLRDSDGRPRFLVREFAQLSLGQQQAIVLGMLLCSSSAAPLLIDQPEDNLDSAFVFQVLVRTLRRIKEHRQVILVTHNANIGVLADSDLVVPLKATADKGRVVSPGSVEQRPTRDLVCEILEGGGAAYRKRGTLYGLS